MNEEERDIDRQKRKKRQKALFSELVGRAGLIRPLASPCGQRCALSYRCAMLEPLRFFILHDSVNYACEKMKSELGGAETKKAPKGAFF
ncbi:TPA: hypothetical protein I9744_004047 [Serratia marcescens]|nr:hypothetical protein [Serratia marcescens]HAT4980837.1 hypothetical protein [Serratia marcescens]